MKLVRYILLMVGIIFLLSCSNKDFKSELGAIRECVNGNVMSKINSGFELDNNHYLIDKFNLYDSIAIIENKMIEDHILENQNQDGYLVLLNELKENNKSFSNYYSNAIKDSFIDYLNHDITTTQLMYDSCPKKIKGKSAELKRIINVYNDIFQSGYPNLESLESLVRMNSFKYDDFRLSILNLILINIKYKHIETKAPPKF